MSDERPFRSIHQLGYSNLLDLFSSRSGAESRKYLHGTEESSGVMEFPERESADQLLLASSGIYLEGVHFDLSYSPLQHLGFKLMTAVASKLYAMNGEPVSAQIDLALPNKVSVEMCEKLFDGFDKGGELYQCNVIARDMTASRHGLIISVHMQGVADRQDLITRKGAQAGDQICVTGDVGGAMAGLRILLREKKAWMETGQDTFHPDLEEYSYVIERQLMPRTRNDLKEAFTSADVKPTSMIELSKGLLNEVQLLAAASEIGCELFLPAIPVALETRQVADEMKEDVDRYACYGGEDYEMLFTLQEGDVEKLQTSFEDFSVIGEIVDRDEGIRLNAGDGSPLDIDNLN